MGASGPRKAAATRKHRAAPQKAATTRKRRATGRKAAATRQRRAKQKTGGTERRTPSVIPMISYEDGIRALEWLASAVGFRETARLTTPDGRLSHGEMRAGHGLIMLASPTPETNSEWSRRGLSSSRIFIGACLQNSEMRRGDVPRSAPLQQSPP